MEGVLRSATISSMVLPNLRRAAATRRHPCPVSRTYRLDSARSCMPWCPLAALAGGCLPGKTLYRRTSQTDSVWTVSTRVRPLECLYRRRTYMLIKPAGQGAYDGPDLCIERWKRGPFEEDHN